MKSVLLLSLLTLGITAHAGEPLQFVSGIPSVAYSNCSGAAFKSENLGNKIHFITATHCVGKIARTIKSTGFATQSMTIMGVTNPLLPGIRFSYPDSNTLNVHDQFIAPSVKMDSAVKTYKLAADVPGIGANIKMAGYPSKGIPFVASYSAKTEFSCSYMGPVLLAVAHNGVKNKVTVLELAKCPKRFFLGGLSGGPVTNAAGELIGTVSQILNPMGEQDVNVTHLIFSRLTESDLAARRALGSKQQPLMPEFSGQLQFHTINYFLPKKVVVSDTTYTEYEIPHTMMTLNLKNDVLDGVQTEYNPDGSLMRQDRFVDGLIQN